MQSECIGVAKLTIMLNGALLSEAPFVAQLLGTPKQRLRTITLELTIMDVVIKMKYALVWKQADTTLSLTFSS